MAVQARNSNKVVDIAEYRAARAPQQARLWDEAPLKTPPPAATARSAAHRKRMLAHLEALPAKAGAWRTMQ